MGKAKLENDGSEEQTDGTQEDKKDEHRRELGMMRRRTRTAVLSARVGAVLPSAEKTYEAASGKRGLPGLEDEASKHAAARDAHEPC